MTSKKRIGSIGAALIVGALFAAVVAAPANAKTEAVHADYIGSGWVYHQAPHYTAAGGLSLTGITGYGQNCQSSTQINLRKTLAASTMAVGGSFYSSSFTFRAPGTITSTSFTFPAGNKYFNAYISNSWDDQCATGWAGTFRSP